MLLPSWLLLVAQRRAGNSGQWEEGQWLIIILVTELQVLPAASLRQERVEGSIVTDHRRRVRDQDHQSRHRREEETDKATGQSDHAQPPCPLLSLCHQQP